MTDHLVLADIVARYLELHPDERQKFELLLQQIADDEALDDRRNFTGHITASAVILAPDRQKILLIHHKAYDQWQQPGGHWEQDDSDPLVAARREGTEETGLQLRAYLPLDPARPLIPLDIDTHAVPARPEKDEPPHYHHDFRYVFVAEKTPPNHQAAEIIAAKWLGFDAPEAKRVQQIIKKLQAAGI